jgi:parallel beta-helix repeat protein
MKKTLLFILLFELSIFNFSFSNTHYVSKTGSSIPPYTSWETAADSIWKGIDAASSGDTVRVGAGTYYEGVVLKQNIALLGAGMDSCIINGNIPSKPQYIVYGADSSVIEGFHVIGRGGTAEDGGVGIYSTVTKNLKRICNNKTINCVNGIWAGGNGSIVCNNISSYNSVGINTDLAGDGLITNNTITHNKIGINLFFGSYYRIIKNIISYTTVENAIGHFIMDSVLIENNLITDMTSEFYSSAIHLMDGGSSRAEILNNTIFLGRNYPAISISYIGADVKNNIVTNSVSALSAFGTSSYVTASYNDLWNNTFNYGASSGAVIDTSLGGNIYKDPMFVGNGDYHLQKYSPCIDAGDPNIKDPDSSRSDMGCYGGLYGETYTYLDLAPKAPDSLKASFDSVSITLTWKPNTEADLSHYLVYEDTIFNFIPDTFKIVGVVSKDSSIFKDHNWEYGKTYYYKLSAYDLTNYQSPYSEELMIKATDVPWTDEIKVEIDKYSLSQNYPNPFNPTTVIVYYLPDIGYQPAEVELTIYNVLGKQVRTLVKERQYPGEHRAVWDGKDDEGNDVASGIYFYRLKVSGVDFVKAKKMTLIR